MAMKLAEGRNFILGLASDSQSIVINQAMAKAMGLTKPVGERIMNWETYTVIGVVEDFHFESMKGAIGPLSLVVGHGGSLVSAKAKSKKIANVLQSGSKAVNKFMPHPP